MTGKNVLYAAVGAPVVAARKVVEAVAELRSTLNKEADSLGKTTNERVAVWADEGEKIVNRITDAKMVDELTSKVDFDQVSTQVSKLRDQLEDMLSTWRASFRPDKMPTVTAQASPDGVKIEAKRSVARKPMAQKTTSRAEKVPASSTVTATVTSKPSAAKAPAKIATARKAAAKTASGTKARAQKAPAKKAPAKKAPAKKAAAKKAAAKKPTSTARKAVAVAS